MKETVCPHYGNDIRERWHQHYGVQKLERGSGEIGVPAVGKVTLRKEALVMVYVREVTNPPFFVMLTDANQE